MKIVQGANLVETSAAALRRLSADHRGVLADIGAGDGRFVYETAKRRPDLLCLGVDAEARNLKRYSTRALRKPARGGAPNVVFLLGAAEDLPGMLAGLATHVTVNLPWGSLLATVVNPASPDFLKLRDLLKPDGLLEMLIAYSASYEPNTLRELGLPRLSEEYIRDRLAPDFEAQEMDVERHLVFDNASVRHLPLTWGRSLTRRRPREFHYFMLRRAGRGEETGPLLFTQLPVGHERRDDTVQITAWGHSNITATNDSSTELTRDVGVTSRGDCIVGVRAQFDENGLERLKQYRKLRVTLRAGDVIDSFICGVNSGFCPSGELVFRKSSYRSERTLGIRASKSARQLSRRLVGKLQSKDCPLQVLIEPEKRRRSPERQPP